MKHSSPLVLPLGNWDARLQFAEVSLHDSFLLSYVMGEIRRLFANVESDSHDLWLLLTAWHAPESVPGLTCLTTSIIQPNACLSASACTSTLVSVSLALIYSEEPRHFSVISTQNCSLSFMTLSFAAADTSPFPNRKRSPGASRAGPLSLLLLHRQWVPASFWTLSQRKRLGSGFRMMAVTSISGVSGNTTGLTSMVNICMEGNTVPYDSDNCFRVLRLDDIDHRSQLPGSSARFESISF